MGLALSRDAECCQHSTRHGFEECHSRSTTCRGFRMKLDYDQTRVYSKPASAIQNHNIQTKSTTRLGFYLGLSLGNRKDCVTCFRRDSKKPQLQLNSEYHQNRNWQEVQRTSSVSFNRKVLEATTT